jgi:DNA polymerase III delta' subunit
MSLKHVLGQQQAVNILLNEIQNNRVKHSYIFYGVNGVGKKCTAIQFSKSLICQNKNDGYSCDVCDDCIKISENIHPDVILVDFDFQQKLLQKPQKSVSISIDTIRYVKQFCGLTRYSGGYKVVIIDHAETLQRDAANSLLKLLEEPPENCVIILITTSLGLLPKTVISRCELIRFCPLNKDILSQILSIKTNFSPIVGSVEEYKYVEQLNNIDTNFSSLSEIQLYSEKIVQDEDFAEYSLVWYTENNLLPKFKNSEEWNKFLDEFEGYIKQFRFNINYQLLIETFLVKAALLCNKNIL